jgi:hypothetical protein
MSMLRRVGLGERAGSEIAIRRVRAGRHQRSAGAWSWYAVDHRGLEIIGSTWSVRELVAASDRVSLYQHPHTHSLELVI